MIDTTVYLTQTDTTIGFVSQSADRLDAIKNRPPDKSYIRAVDSLSTLKEFTRIPPLHRNRLRRAHKTTFILPDGASYRVIRDPRHLILIGQLKWAYTTSANRSGKGYDEAWARSAADTVIEPLSGRGCPSTILRIEQKKVVKLR
jgi:tRNA A37 threonylcarbamoyladenosine synthetase subunit TsaC/SUA5/YrdC